MGRKTNTKGKEKRLQRKEEQLKLIAAKIVVDNANKLEDPLQPFPVFRKFSKNNVEVELSVSKVANLHADVIDWIFNLTKKNMFEKYKSCSWGWNDVKKREELTEESAWYLLAKSNNEYVGFSHFRFDLDYGDEVLYCYELQLEKKVHRKGLGKFMMQVLELIAFKNNMKKVVLTVLKNCPEAKSFYAALKYNMDETSPTNDYETEYPYEILSKYNKRLVSEPPNAHLQKSVPQTPSISSLMMNNHCCSSPHCH
ncbi:N-alpha-acetyltransferase 40 [Chrysoperla carnea]|uniref:N-alpha-acetyltransferase 40 n=1 Tax=Chrysoperla carnea TaxID=189513 RepID=UPI001D0998F9|nr:N-alpha-acetyltransferase 40 [Chrysoperla carnea]